MTNHSSTQMLHQLVLELQHKIEELQNKVTDLQSKVNDLSGVATPLLVALDTYFQESAENF